MVVIQWIPGHADVFGNEEADKLAATGSAMEQSVVPIEYYTASTAISRHYRTKREAELMHAGIRPPPARDKEHGLSKRERRILSQLRCGAKCPILKSYLHQIGKSPDPSCTICKGEIDDLNHMLWECPIGDKHREFYLPVKSNDVLYDEPCNVIKFLRACTRIQA